MKNYVNNLVYTTPGTKDGRPFSGNYSVIIYETNSDFQHNRNVRIVSKERDFKDTINIAELGGTYDTLSFFHNDKKRYFIIKPITYPSEGTYKYFSDSSIIYGIGYGYSNYDSYGFDIVFGSGTKYDNKSAGLIQEYELVPSNDSLIFEQSIIYKSETKVELDLDTSIEPISWTGYKNENVIDYEGRFYVKNPAETDSIDFAVTNDGEIVEEFSIRVKTPSFKTIGDGGFIYNDHIINLNEVLDEEFDIYIEFDNTTYPLSFVDTELNTKFYDVISASVDENILTASLVPKGDYYEQFSDTIRFNFNFGFTHEIIINGVYSASGIDISTSEIPDTDEGSSTEMTLEISNNCEDESLNYKKLEISEINISTLDEVEVQHDINLPIEIEPGETKEYAITLSSSEAGEYKIEFEVESNADFVCENEAVSYVKFLSTKSVEVLPDSFMSLSPNPATDFLEISLDDNFNGILTITNLNGMKVYSQKINNSNITLELDKFSKGTYFIELSNNKNKISRKFIKN